MNKRYKAFSPKPLPPDDPPIAIGRELLERLSLADRTLGRLDGSILLSILYAADNMDGFALHIVRCR